MRAGPCPLPSGTRVTHGCDGDGSDGDVELTDRSTPAIVGDGPIKQSRFCAAIEHHDAAAGFASTATLS